MKRLFFLWPLLILPVFGGGPIDIRTSDFPWAIVNTEYHSLIETAVDARCPDGGDVILSLSDGRLPRGVEVGAGYLAGTPKELGRFQFSLRAENNCSSMVKAFELIVTGKPMLKVFPEEFTFVYRAGEAGPAPTVQVSASWPELPYSLRTDVPWLTSKVRGGVTPTGDSGLASDAVTLEINPKNLDPGTYHAAVRFSTQMGANSPMVAVTLKVVAPE
jgi:hypothetical protein